MNKEHKQTLFTNILKLIKQFPQGSYEELTILFIDLLKTFKDEENFFGRISDLQDCELKRILLNELRDQ